MSLFIIQLQSIFGRSFAKPLANVFRKTFNDPLTSNIFPRYFPTSSCSLLPTKTQQFQIKPLCQET